MRNKKLCCFLFLTLLSRIYCRLPITPNNNMSVGLTSSEGIIPQLDEVHPEIIQTALTKLDNVVHYHWHEISYHINKLQGIYENTTLPDDIRYHAALVMSKVHFHLGEYSKCADCTLQAGPKFSLQDDTEYTHTVTTYLLDRYVQLRVDGAFEVEIDPRLHNIINQIVDNSLAKGQHKIVIGFALDTQRLDLLIRALEGSKESKELLAYSLRLCTDLVTNRQLRKQVLEIIVDYKPAFYDLFQCLILLDDSERATTEICRIYNSKDEDLVLQAYQSVFDIYQDAPQSFTYKLIVSLSQSVSEVDISPLLSILNGKVPTTHHLLFLRKENKTDPEILKDSMLFANREPVLKTALGVSNAFMNAGTTNEDFLRTQRQKLTRRCENWSKYTAVASLGVIHRGNESVAQQVLAEYFPDPKNPNVGGGGDQGVEEENIEIYDEINEAGDAYEEDGNESDDEEYVFGDITVFLDEEEENEDLFTPDNNGFIEGGAFYALGLIHANRSSLPVINTFLDRLNTPINTAVCRGACLGLGLVAMSLGDEYPIVVEALQDKLNGDDAVIGESAAISLGLVSLETFNEQRISEMIEYSLLTEHEKIQRGIAVGLALICFGHKERANRTITLLVKYKDNALLRRAGAMSLGMAYCGTSNSQATKKLLQIGVTDNDYDVRRAAVISIGFVMAGNPEESLKTLLMLGDSYNPHTRYAVAMALGIACAGSGDLGALNYLKTLVKDKEDFVIQGALIASSMILVQQTEKINPNMKQFMKLYEDVIRSRFADEMAKFGAILAQGIVNAGGRNVNISLKSRTGQLRTQGIVGMFLFTQYWYWFPMSLNLMLSFVPTCVIGVDKNLKIPELEIVSNCRSALFSYPVPITKTEGQIIRKRVADAMLSYTLKEIAKKLKNLDETVGEILQEVEKAKKEEKSKSDSDIIANDTPFTYLKNPCRVLKPQLKYLLWKQNDRYELTVPKALHRGGFLVLKDNQPNLEVLEVSQHYKKDIEVAEDAEENEDNVEEDNEEAEDLEIEAEEDEENVDEDEENAEDLEIEAEEDEENAEDLEIEAEEDEENADEDEENADEDEENAEDLEIEAEEVEENAEDLEIEAEEVEENAEDLEIEAEEDEENADEDEENAEDLEVEAEEDEENAEEDDEENAEDYEEIAEDDEENAEEEYEELEEDSDESDDDEDAYFLSD